MPPENLPLLRINYPPGAPRIVRPIRRRVNGENRNKATEAPRDKSPKAVRVRRLSVKAAHVDAPRILSYLTPSRRPRSAATDA